MAVQQNKNSASKRGMHRAHDFLTKPILLTQLESSIQRAVEGVRMRRELAHFRESQKSNLNFVKGTNPTVLNTLSSNTG